MSFEEWRKDFNENNICGMTERDAYKGGYEAGLKVAPEGYRLVKIAKIVGNPNVNWKIAPEWAKYWLVDGSSGRAWWCSKRPSFDKELGCYCFQEPYYAYGADMFGYTGGVKESITYRSHMEG